jgi:hypothetical protein
LSKSLVSKSHAISLGLAHGEKVWGVVHAKKESTVVSPCEYWDVGIPEDFMAASKRILNLKAEQLESLDT